MIEKITNIEAIQKLPVQELLSYYKIYEIYSFFYLCNCFPYIFFICVQKFC